MSYLSPWDRSSSDPNLSPPGHPEPGSHFITGVRHSRRPIPPQSQFRSSLTVAGDLEFRPEYREAYGSYPPDACVSPKHARYRRRQSPTVVEGVKEVEVERARKVDEEREGVSEKKGEGVEVEAEAEESSPLGTEDGATQSQLANEKHGGQEGELSRHSSAVTQPRNSTISTIRNLRYQTETKSNYVIPSLEERVKLLRRATTLHLEGEQYFIPEYKSNYLDSPRKQYKKALKPRSNLYCEGEFNCETEVHSHYLPYNNIVLNRPVLIRHNTQLLIEGDMNICPEYRASYIEHPRQRPVVIRPRENLHITGPEAIMVGVSEQREKFSNLPLTPRPNLIRRPSTLYLGSDVSDEVREVMRRPRPATVHANFASPSGEPGSTPEYRDSFRDFPRNRPELSRPAGTLNTEGPWLGRSPEYRAAFTDFPRQRPEVKKHSDTLKPFHDKTPENKESFKDFTRKRPQGKKIVDNIKPINDLQATSPEYKEQYKNFPRQRPDVKKGTETLKPEGELMQTSPEYKEKYKNFPRQRPEVKKATETLKPEGKFTDQNAEYKENYKDSPRMRPKVIKPSGNLQPEGEIMETSAEYKSSYKEYPLQRPIVKKPTENLRPEGEIFDQNPEYRDSYINFPRQRPGMTRRPEGNLRAEGQWLGRFPEYRAAFIDLPRHRPIMLRPPGALGDPDTLGGGYAPTFDGTSRLDLLRPNSAGSPRSRSPAGVPTGAPKHNKRSSSKEPRVPRRPVSRAGHLDEAFPPSKLNPALLVAQPSQESIDSYQVKTTPDRQVKFVLPLSPRNQRSSPTSPSSFKVLEATDPAPPRVPVDFRAAKGRPGTGEGKWGTGWLSSPPANI